MKLNDLDVDAILAALRKERSDWIDVAVREHRKATPAETNTICILAAWEHVIDDARRRTETSA